MEQESHKGRQYWIDILRGAAILGVVLGHSMDIFYQIKNVLVWKHLIYTIPWFIFLSGTANAISFRGKNLYSFRTYLNYYWRRISFLIPYIIATAVIYFFQNQHTFSPVNIFRNLINFSIQPTFYFINLILQLYIIFPLLFFINIIFKRGPKKIIFMIILFFLSFYVFTANYVYWPFNEPLLFKNGHIFWPAGIIGALFGGFYLFIFYLGIDYANIQAKRIKYQFLISVPLFLLLELYLIKTGDYGPPGWGNYFVFAWSMAGIYIARELIEIVRKIGIKLSILQYLGRASLVIYLYHYFILTILRNHQSGSFFDYLIAVSASIFIPFLIYYWFLFFKQKIRFLLLK